LGFRVQGFGFIRAPILILGFRVYGLWFWVFGFIRAPILILGFRVQGFGFIRAPILILGFGVQGLGFRIDHLSAEHTALDGDPRQLKRVRNLTRSNIKTLLAVQKLRYLFVFSD